MPGHERLRSLQHKVRECSLQTSSLREVMTSSNPCLADHVDSEPSSGSKLGAWWLAGSGVDQYYVPVAKLHGWVLPGAPDSCQHIVDLNGGHPTTLMQVYRYRAPSSLLRHHSFRSFPVRDAYACRRWLCRWCRHSRTGRICSLSATQAMRCLTWPHAMPRHPSRRCRSTGTAHCSVRSRFCTNVDHHGGGGVWALLVE